MEKNWKTNIKSDMNNWLIKYHDLDLTSGMKWCQSGTARLIKVRSIVRNVLPISMLLSTKKWSVNLKNKKVLILFAPLAVLKLK